MKILTQIERMKYVDWLIKRKATGTPKQLASKLNVSVVTVYRYIRDLKDMEHQLSTVDIVKVINTLMRITNLNLKYFEKIYRLSKNDSGHFLFCTWLVGESDQLAKGSRKLDRVGII